MSVLIPQHFFCFRLVKSLRSRSLSSIPSLVSTKYSFRDIAWNIHVLIFFACVKECLYGYYWRCACGKNFDFRQFRQFSDHLLSIIHPFFHKLYTYLTSSPELSDQLLTKLVIQYHQRKGIQNCSNEGSHLFHRGDN